MAVGKMSNEEIIEAVKEYFKNKNNKVINFTNFVAANSKLWDWNNGHWLAVGIAYSFKETGEYEVEIENETIFI